MKRIQIQKEIQVYDRALSLQLFAFKPYYVNEISTKVPFLVHEKEIEIRKTLEAWSKEKESFNRTYFEQLLKEKKIFPNVNGVDISAVKQVYGTKGSEVNKLKRKFAPLHMYINRGTEENPVYVKASASRGEINDKLSLQYLIAKGEAFTNYTQLLEVEKEEINELKLTRLVNSKFEVMSKPWMKWARYMESKGKYTLKMGLVETLSPHSGLPDFFATDKGLTRPAGWIGTLFENEESLEEKDNWKESDGIPIPWPAFQEIPWHVRWPSPHPFINPPILWMAKMGLFDKTVLKRYPNLMETDNPEPLEKDPDDSPIVAGPYMLSKDAVRIAKYGTKGAERDESIQKHVGSWHPEPVRLPFYQPEYNATNMPDADKYPYHPLIYEMMGLRHPIEDIVKIQEEVSEEEKEEEAERMKKIKALGIELPDTSKESMEEDEQKEMYERVYPILEKEMSPYLDRYEDLRHDIFNHSKENYYYSDFRNQTGIPEEFLTEEIKAKLPKEGYFIIVEKEDPDPYLDNIIIKVPNSWPITYLVWQEYKEERLPLPIQKMRYAKDYVLKNQLQLLKQYNPHYRRFNDEVIDKEAEVKELDKYIQGIMMERKFTDDFYEKIAQKIVKASRPKGYNLTPAKKGEERAFFNYTQFSFEERGLGTATNETVSSNGLDSELGSTSLDSELDQRPMNFTEYLENNGVPFFYDPMIQSYLELNTFAADKESTTGQTERRMDRTRMRKQLRDFKEGLESKMVGFQILARGFNKMLAKHAYDERKEAERQEAFKNLTGRYDDTPRATIHGTPIYKIMDEPTEEEKDLLLKYREKLMKKYKEYDEADPFDLVDEDDDDDDDDYEDEDEDEDDVDSENKPKKKRVSKKKEKKIVLEDPDDARMKALARKYGINIDDDDEDEPDPYEEREYVELDEKIEGEDEEEEDLEKDVEYEPRPELVSAGDNEEYHMKLYRYRRKTKETPEDNGTVSGDGDVLVESSPHLDSNSSTNSTLNAIQSPPDIQTVLDNSVHFNVTTVLINGTIITNVNATATTAAANVTTINAETNSTTLPANTPLPANQKEQDDEATNEVKD